MPVLKRVAHDARSSGSRRTLTQRELQILEALADGLPNKTSRIELSLSEETIKSHLRSFTKSSVQPTGRTPFRSRCGSD